MCVDAGLCLTFQKDKVLYDFFTNNFHPLETSKGFQFSVTFPFPYIADICSNKSKETTTSLDLGRFNGNPLLFSIDKVMLREQQQLMLGHRNGEIAEH